MDENLDITQRAVRDILYVQGVVATLKDIAYILENDTQVYGDEREDIEMAKEHADLIRKLAESLFPNG